MDSNLVIAIVSAGSTAGVAITALLVSNKRIDRVESALDRLESHMENRFERMESRLERMETRFMAKLDSIDTRLEMLTGSVHDLDKRLSVMGPRKE